MFSSQIILGNELERKESEPKLIRDKKKALAEVRGHMQKVIVAVACILVLSIILVPAIYRRYL